MYIEDLQYTQIDLRRFVLVQNHEKIHGDAPYKLSELKLTKRRNKSKKENEVDTPLNIKIKAHDVEQAKLLIVHGTDLNAPGLGSWRPLHVAVKYNQHKLVKFLIENGAQLNCAIIKKNKPGLNNVTGFTPLHIAAMMNHLDSAKLLLENGARVSPKTATICDPVHIAVFRGHLDMVSLLLDHGAEVNLRYSNTFFTEFNHVSLTELWQNQNLPLLHCAILQNLKKMAELLINRGADINLKTSKGKTTLMQAVEMNNTSLVKDLLAKGMNVNDRDNFGQPVLHFTMVNTLGKRSMYCQKSHCWAASKIRTVTCLVEAGADINATFPLQQSRASIIHYMIKYGFDLGVFYLMDQAQFNFAGIDLETVKSAQLIKRNLTPDIKEDWQYISNLEDRFEAIRNFLMQYTVARHVMGLPVDERILQCPFDARTVEDHLELVEVIKDYIVTEKEYLKDMTFGDKTKTIWDLVNCDFNQLAEVMADPNMRLVMDLLGNSRSEMTFFLNLLFNRMSILDERIE